MRKEAQTADINAAEFVEVIHARAPRGFCAAIRTAAVTAQVTRVKLCASLSEKLQGAPERVREATFRNESWNRLERPPNRDLAMAHSKMRSALHDDEWQRVNPELALMLGAGMAAQLGGAGLSTRGRSSAL